MTEPWIFLITKCVVHQIPASSLQTPCLILPARTFVPPCGSSSALFFLASSFLVFHPIFYFHTPSWPSVPVSLFSPGLPSFPAFPSLPPSLLSLASPLPPVPQFPPIFPFLLANDNTFNYAYDYIITERKIWKSYHINRLTFLTYWRYPS